MTSVDYLHSQFHLTENILRPYDKEEPVNVVQGKNRSLFRESQEKLKYLHTLWAKWRVY
jgi:hypothetical protein